MTPAQLKTAIDADPQALTLATAGNDAGCAARMSAILPSVVASRVVTDMDIPDAIITALETGAGTIPRVARFLARLASSGVDIGEARVRTACDKLAAAAVINATQRDTLKDLALQPQTITADMVSLAMLPTRPGGKIP